MGDEWQCLMILITQNVVLQWRGEGEGGWYQLSLCGHWALFSLSMHSITSPPHSVLRTMYTILSVCWSHRLAREGDDFYIRKFLGFGTLTHFLVVLLSLYLCLFPSHNFTTHNNIVIIIGIINQSLDELQCLMILITQNVVLHWRGEGRVDGISCHCVAIGLSCFSLSMHSITSEW